MLQYLLNISCIWALGLVIYFALLRKETFHAFNRAYLLWVLSAGISIPLFTWQTDLPLFAAGATVRGNFAYNYIEQSAAIQQKVVTGMQPGGAVNVENILWTIYLAGAVIVTGLLVKDIVGIIRLYRTGHKIKRDRYTLVETGKSISPCSAFGCVFISDEKNYTKQELDLVIGHELRHIQLRHSIDMVFVQLLQVIFWFHPLVYLYKRSLQMVHESRQIKLPCKQVITIVSYS